MALAKLPACHLRGPEAWVPPSGISTRRSAIDPLHRITLRRTNGRCSPNQPRLTQMPSAGSNPRSGCNVEPFPQAQMMGSSRGCAPPRRSHILAIFARPIRLLPTYLLRQRLRQRYRLLSYGTVWRVGAVHGLWRILASPGRGPSPTRLSARSGDCATSERSRSPEPRPRPLCRR
jgi:hypothetical protein